MSGNNKKEPTNIVKSMFVGSLFFYNHTFITVASFISEIDF
ncbi:hypothetical protein RV17_GL001449 [Enterococcus thailandicus]|nr:hypothetical protein RV17_GL001449 [Enterococcus thailandicus]